MSAPAGKMLNPLGAQMLAASAPVSKVALAGAPSCCPKRSFSVAATVTV
jgi:hypothetical protein